MESRNSSPILPLTTIRFFAAFYIVLLHSAIWAHRIDVSTWVGRFLRTGYTAVGFFFVLSGYILAHVYLNTERAFSGRSFLVARFARAYPLLFVSLLIDAPNALILRLQMFPLKAALLKMPFMLLSEMLLLQSWSLHFRTINAPSWSLSAEAFFYLAFPVCALWIWRRKGLAAAWLMLFFWGCALLAPIVVTATHPALFVENDSSALQWGVELMPAFRIFEFFAGISLCALQQSIAAKLSAEKRSRFGYIALAAACVWFIVVIEFANHVPLLVMSNGFLLPAYSLLILGLTNVRGWLASAFSHRYPVILGEASYAVYLLHDPVWVYFSRVHVIDTPPLWLLYLGIVFAASIASFFLLERPAREYILNRARVRPLVVQEQEKVAIT